MFINYINREKFYLKSSLILLLLSLFLLGCSTSTSQSIEESVEDNSTEKTEIIENSVESWESCDLLPPASAKQIKCWSRIPEREYAEAWGTVIDPVKKDGKYYYTCELLGIEMILDYPFSEHIYVVERKLPRESGIEVGIYAYEVVDNSVYWDSCLYLKLMDAETVEAGFQEEWTWEHPIVKLNEEVYLVSFNTLSFTGSANMLKLLEENLVTISTLDEFLEHAEFNLIN